MARMAMPMGHTKPSPTCGPPVPLPAAPAKKYGFVAAFNTALDVSHGFKEGVKDNRHE